MVTLSGFVGRYLYSQIPRSLNAAELTMKEIQDKEAALKKELAEQRAAFGFSVDALYQLPSAADVAETPAIASLISMLFIDFKRPFRTSWVRLQQAGFGAWLFSFGGFLPTRNHRLERAIKVAKTEAKLSKSIAFLSRTQRIFQLWHVIHRTFSYAFAILAIIHIALALYMGYRI